MTQQTTNETHQSPTVDLDASKSLDRIRQRLGSLTAPAQTVQMKTPESPMAATVPFDGPSVHRADRTADNADSDPAGSDGTVYAINVQP